MKAALRVTAMLVLLGAGILDAQIIRPVRTTGPLAWTSLSVGWFQHQELCDPDTSACWNFGGAPQFRGTLEMPVGTGAALGITGTMARVPMVYAGQAGAPRSCGLCDADGKVSQLMLNFHVGGGSGLHQVIDLYAGYTFFHDFRSSDGAPLGSDNLVDDFSFGLGYGFGYTISPRAQVIVVQDLAMLIHKRQSGSAQNTAQQRTTRIGVRLGLGSR